MKTLFFFLTFVFFLFACSMQTKTDYSKIKDPVLLSRLKAIDKEMADLTFKIDELRVKIRPLGDQIENNSYEDEMRGYEKQKIALAVEKDNLLKPLSVDEQQKEKDK